jgi:hypothetical protein
MIGLAWSWPRGWKKSAKLMFLVLVQNLGQLKVDVSRLAMVKCAMIVVVVESVRKVAPCEAARERSDSVDAGGRSLRKRWMIDEEVGGDRLAGRSGSA